MRSGSSLPSARAPDRTTLPVLDASLDKERTVPRGGDLLTYGAAKGYVV
jgi:hypothetical protein